MRKPSSGKIGMSQTSFSICIKSDRVHDVMTLLLINSITWVLPLQQINLIDRDCFAVAEQRNDDAQPDSRFCRRHHYDEDSEDRSRKRVDSEPYGLSSASAS